MLPVMAKKILLATTLNWPSTTRLAGAFASLGCRVEAVCPPGHVLRISRYLGCAHRYRPLHPLSSFAAALANAKPDLVIPCDDRAVSHLLALHQAGCNPETAALLVRSLGRIESHPILLARSPAIAAARAEGVAAPLTVAVGTEGELIQALEISGFPAVVKADASWGGDNVAIVRTPEEARRAFRKLHGPPSRLRSVVRSVLRNDPHFLHAAWAPKAATVNVQHFIPGKPATSALACRDGEVLAALHMDVVDWRGKTGPACLIKRVDCPVMDEAARRIARHFALNGLHGLDFVRDDCGVPHLIEVNPRATQVCHLVLGAGNDLAAALVGEGPRPVTTEAETVALFPQAWENRPEGPCVSGIFSDVPWDDSAVLQAIAGHRLRVAPQSRSAAPPLQPQIARS